MATIALFHSVLGARAGVHAAGDLLRSHGHRVEIVDQYDGRVFDDYDEAAAYATTVGYPALMSAAVDAVADLPAGLVCAGFSNGGGMSTHVATVRKDVGAVVLFSGALDPAMLGITQWPGNIAVQTHYSVGDPFRNQDWIDALAQLVNASGAPFEFFDYPGDGHLFTDPSLPDEYNSTATGLLWERTVAFLERET